MFAVCRQMYPSKKKKKENTARETPPALGILSFVGSMYCKSVANYLVQDLIF